MLLVLTFAAYRLQRIVTSDDWPPSEAFRDAVERRFGAASSWYVLVTCPWCFGFWVSIAVMAEHHFLHVVPLWVYGIFAISAGVGLLAEAIES